MTRTTTTTPSVIDNSATTTRHRSSRCRFSNSSAPGSRMTWRGGQWNVDFHTARRFFPFLFFHIDRPYHRRIAVNPMREEYSQLSATHPSGTLFAEKSGDNCFCFFSRSPRYLSLFELISFRLTIHSYIFSLQHRENSQVRFHRV